MTIAQFCDCHQISTASFYSWRRKLATSDPPTEAITLAPSDRFLNVEVIQTASIEMPFRVHLSGAVIEIPAQHRDALLGVVGQLQQAAQATQSIHDRGERS